MFRPRTIPGLPSALDTQTPPHKDEAHIITLLDALKKQLSLELRDSQTEAMDGDIAFSVLESPSSSVNDAFIANAFDFLHKQRASTTYQTIHQKIMAGDMPSPNEILYFSLVTDNVTLLTNEMVLHIKTIKTPHTDCFHSHINLLLYSTELAKVTDENRKRLLIISLEQTLSARRAAIGRLVFCNLASINLSQACFGHSSFQWLNLENANFSNCIFNDYIFKDCMLEGANFQQVQTSTIDNASYLSFINCRLNKVNFSNTTLSMEAKGCQFDDANFRQADLKAKVYGCTLKGCRFDSAAIDPQTTIDSLSLSGCNLAGTLLNAPIKSALANADTSVKLFGMPALNNTTALTERLNTLLPLPTFNATQLSDYRTVIAKVLLNELKDMNEDTKRMAITTALEHSLFATKNMLKQSLNGVASFCGFFSAPRFETTAEGLLKNALLPPAAPPLKNH